VTVLWETAGHRVVPGLETVYPAVAASVAALVIGSLVTPPPRAGQLRDLS
jgi:hypothetical protein